MHLFSTRLSVIKRWLFQPAEPSLTKLQLYYLCSPCQNDLYKHIASFLTGKFLFYLNFYNTQ